MAISQENEKIAEIYIKSAETSQLPLEEQAAWTELINSCKIATNGFSQQEKIQKMSENTLRMVGRMLYDRIQTVKANQEFKNSNEKINKSIDNVNKEFSEKFDQLKSTTTALEKKMDSRLDSIEQMVGILTENLLQNSKDTYTTAGKVDNELKKEKKNQGWLKTLFDGLDKIKWAIVTLGSVITVACCFRPEIGDALEHIFGMFLGH